MLSRLGPGDEPLHYSDGSHRWLGIEPHDSTVRAHQIAHRASLDREPVARSPRDTAPAGYERVQITFVHDDRLPRAS